MTERLFDFMFACAEEDKAPPLVVSDGGRARAGFSCNRHVGDCVTRAIAQATGISYAEVYAGMWARIRSGPAY